LLLELFGGVPQAPNDQRPGPGAIHLLNGLSTAEPDHHPAVITVVQQKRGRRGRLMMNFFQHEKILAQFIVPLVKK
jgi:thiamine pyrophosphate-dependent acetolactate synthase large subunit-like protein